MRTEPVMSRMFHGWLTGFFLFGASTISFADPVEVMSFNIRYGTARDGENHWDLRKAAVLEVIRTHHPQVLGLQEALRFQLDAFRDAFPEYTEIGVGRDDGKTRGEYAAILLDTNRFRVVEQGTFWLSDTPDVPGSRSWGNNIPRICTWVRCDQVEPPRPWLVYNAHLDHQSHPSRQRSAAAILAHIQARAHTGPVLLMGDFNMSIQDASLQAALKPGAGFQDLLAPFDASTSHTGTFHPWNGRTTGPRIDHLLYRGPEQVSEAAVLNRTYLDRWPSDHFPVRAALWLDTPGEKP